MAHNLLYRIGRIFVLALPLKFSYSVARILADIYYSMYDKERRAVTENLKIILNRPSGDTDKELQKIVKEVFRNFAKYLVDFLRFSLIDPGYINKNVKLADLSNLEEALKQCKGVILLSAHLGNWELGGYVLGKLGYSINAVVLTHKNEKVNEFFINQRGMGNFKSIEIGASLRTCYKALKNNELLALMGDRNFSSTGLVTEFFGRPVLMPKGPSVLGLRTGAVIVPTYMVRENDDTFKMVFEKPIYPESGGDEDAAVEKLMKSYLPSLENAIRRYPHQWYVFREFWGKTHGKN
ncbi:MAG: lysophospholipid acyltransferase family protein [Candidatus Omnitrophota bacterium]|nr:lysophospholipid acyltransferase family protein [Candidatus Omnitrophota bacterium]